MHTVAARYFIAGTGSTSKIARGALLALLGAVFLTMVGRVYVASSAGTDYPEPIGAYLD